MAPQHTVLTDMLPHKVVGTVTILKVFIWTRYQILGLWDVLFEMTKKKKNPTKSVECLPSMCEALGLIPSTTTGCGGAHL